ncbi:MAG TPA: UBP-type zinc finger domain-containing protein [Dehalococcoidia bacterium]|nr:UBP-type zinc finger domain-containing protein [Dehalococcoidia bacterium]MDP6274306.1 UBP-type zinc finger domain-containing protein [Dehalococcoidia bacterium]MDP7160197.1 UBP-type zinc finger domain-containing protein [Dehalococcoidia bacterium]MDP7214290.1 UBP-type zinc finger domain-containing protein [Dehalococcoidia bacterium]MDP7514183.1 UBP-type zinc finger domain-containing protein [Dehalococcoidia bacterium]
MTCVEMGDEWVNLRMCYNCGKVGCCDSSKYKHATSHYDAIGHPIIKSHMPGGTWKFCFVKELAWE